MRNSEAAKDRSRQPFIMETSCFCWYLNYTFPADTFGSVMSAVGKLFFFLPGKGRINAVEFSFLAPVTDGTTFSLTAFAVETEGEQYSWNHQFVAIQRSMLTQKQRGLWMTKIFVQQIHSPMSKLLLFRFYRDSFDKNCVEYYIHLKSLPSVPCHSKRLEVAHQLAEKEE